MPLTAATAAKAPPYLRSLSRMRYRGCCPNGVGRAQLLRHPARPERDHEAGVHRSEKRVGDGQEATGPDVLGVVMQEGRP